VDRLVDRLTEDPERNQRLWLRRTEPAIGKVQPWCSEFLAPSTVLVEGDLLVMHVEGSGQGREQIGVFSCPVAEVERQAWVPHPGNPILEAGDDGTFDRGSVFDRSVIRFEDRYLLYYSATTGDAHGFATELLAGGTGALHPSGETIGLAVGDDPFSFAKSEWNPIMDGRCPHAFVWQGGGCSSTSFGSQRAATGSTSPFRTTAFASPRFTNSQSCRPGRWMSGMRGP